MRIKSDITLTSCLGGKHSYTITKAMGIVSHFPKVICQDLIAKGAVEVGIKKSSKEAAGDSA